LKTYSIWRVFSSEVQQNENENIQNLDNQCNFTCECGTWLTEESLLPVLTGALLINTLLSIINAAPCPIGAIRTNGDDEVHVLDSVQWLYDT